MRIPFGFLVPLQDGISWRAVPYRKECSKEFLLNERKGLKTLQDDVGQLEELLLSLGSGRDADDEDQGPAPGGQGGERRAAGDRVGRPAGLVGARDGDGLLPAAGFTVRGFQSRLRLGGSAAGRVEDIQFNSASGAGFARIGAIGAGPTVPHVGLWDRRVHDSYVGEVGGNQALTENRSRLGGNPRVSL